MHCMHACVEGHLKEEYCQQSIRVRTQVSLRRVTDICRTTSDKSIRDLTVSITVELCPTLDEHNKWPYSGVKQ